MVDTLTVNLYDYTLVVLLINFTQGDGPCLVSENSSRHIGSPLSYVTDFLGSRP